MKVWLPAKADQFMPRFQPTNGWSPSMDVCRQICIALNDQQRQRAVEAHAAAVADAEQRLAEIRIINSFGIDCPLPELTVPDEVRYRLWQPIPIPHTPGSPDYPSNGIVWLVDHCTPLPRPAENADEVDLGMLPDEPGEWRMLPMLTRWAPRVDLAWSAGELDEDAYQRAMAAARTRHAEQVAAYTNRTRAFLAVQSQGLQPTFSELPHPEKPGPEPTYEQWFAEQSSFLTERHPVSVTRVTP